MSQSQKAEPWELISFDDTLEIIRGDESTKYARSHMIIVISRLQPPDKLLSTETGALKDKFTFTLGSYTINYTSVASRELIPDVGWQTTYKKYLCTQDEIIPESPPLELIRRQQTWEYYGNEYQINFT